MFHLLHLLHCLILFPELWWWLLIPKAHKCQSLQQLIIPCRLTLSTFNTSATQTRPFQSNQTTQTFPQQNTQAIQTDLGLNENLTLYSTDSSTSTDIFDETVSINKLNSNRKRKSHKNHLSNKCSHTKQRKQVTFTQGQQNSSELLDKTIPMSEIRPILETYEQQLQTFQSSRTFETLGANCNQPLVQPTSYHNESQPMSTQQKCSYGSSSFNKFLWWIRYCH